MAVEKSEAHRSVIVRGLRGEPKRLIAGRIRGRLIEVLSLDKTASICLPDVDVFTFNKTLFQRLVAAFKAGGEDAVRPIWPQATKYVE